MKKRKVHIKNIPCNIWGSTEITQDINKVTCKRCQIIVKASQKRLRKQSVKNKKFINTF